MLLELEIPQTQEAWIKLRQQAEYWKAQHGRAVLREAALREKSLHFEQINRNQSERIKELTQKVAELSVTVSLLQKQLFGRKTEKRDKVDNTLSSKQQSLDTSQAKRSRGKQIGTNGYGRKLHPNLPTIEILHDIPEEEKQCRICGRPYRPFPRTEDSEEITIEIHVVRNIHKRKQYIPDCDCETKTGIISAPPVTKLIPKGMFSIDFWVHILLEKYLFQRPMNKIIETLKLEGLDISQGTITGGLQKIAGMIQPLYTRILEKNRSANHWHMDETRWMLFVCLDENITSQRWWLWVAVTKDTCAYILDPTRSAKVPKNHLGENPKGIINADRYSVYKSLGKYILIAFCWSHLRRDFIRIHDSRKKLRPWANDWLRRISQIYQLNEKRLKVLQNHQAFTVADQKLRQSINLMQQAYKKQLQKTNLHPLQRKTLESLDRHWFGYITFVDHPQAPMDNNLSERKLRNPVLGRKNYYGCGSFWSGTLSVSLFTIFQTLLMNNIHPKKFMRNYFTACTQNHGSAPDNIDSFLPWNLSQQQKSTYLYPEAIP